MSLYKRLSLKYCIYYLIIIIGYVISYLPFCIQIEIGTIIGRVFYTFGKRRRKITKINIDLAFAELPQSERDELVKKHFIAAGISIIETAMSWFSPDWKLKHLGHFSGLENLQAAQNKGKGVIMLGFHFTCMEIGGGILSQYTKFDALYRPHSNSQIEAVYKEKRIKRFGGAIDRNDIKSMIRSLKKGNTVWYAPDQNYGGKNSVFSPFFGILAATNTATSRLARISGAAVVPIYFRRLPKYQGYEIRLLPALDDFPSNDVQADTDMVNNIFEDLARNCPEQYLWMHRRFKDRPNGETRFY